MANNNHIGSRTARAIGYYRIASGIANLAAVANAVVAMPIMDGGITNSGNSATSGCYIPRRVTVVNQNGTSANMTNIFVSVGKTNDGANLICNSQALSNIGGYNNWQDLTLNGTSVGNVAIDGTQSQALFVNVTGNAVTNATCELLVYGDLIDA